MPISLLKINSIRLVGGMAVLDFLNTCNGRRPGSSLEEVTDNLLSLEDVLYWCHHARVINADELSNALSLASPVPFQHAQAFEQLISFRESLYQLLLPIAEGRRITAASLEFLNKALVETATCRRLEPAGFESEWVWQRWTTLEQLTAGLIGRLAVQASGLLTSPDLARLKICSTLACDWLFVDMSKNGRRRWCQMTVCGSREKAKKALAVHERVTSA
ncbi:MAG: hypothetical protein JWP80_1767 [Pseudomonas sp.]|nr:hypothetical protein [Pseudomonas sp.]